MELRNRAQWVVWRAVPKNDGSGSGKVDKVPVNPATGGNAATNDPATWGTLGQAMRRWRQDDLAGVGYVFAEGDPYFGYDLDGCIDENGRLDMWAWEIIEAMGTYAEVSPSGRGVKGIGRGRLTGKGGHSPTDPRIEVYDRGRFFTVTGQLVKGVPATIEDCTQQLPKFLAEYFPRMGEAKAGGNGNGHKPGDYSFTQDVAAAATALDQLADWRCDDYDSWLHVGMALAQLGDVGLAMWERWSQGSPKYEPGVCAAKWATIKAGEGITLGSLIAWAREDTPPPAPAEPPVADPGGAGAGARDCTGCKFRREFPALVDLHTLTLGVLKNPDLGHEGKTALAAVWEAQRAQVDGKADADGWLPVRQTRIAEKTGYSPKTTSAHLARLAEWGVLERKVVPGHVDYSTGEMVPAQTYLRLAGSPAETLHMLADLKPERPKMGRPSMRHCPDHPTATLKTITHFYCEDCGQEVGSPRVAHVEPDQPMPAEAEAEAENENTEQDDRPTGKTFQGCESEDAEAEADASMQDDRPTGKTFQGVGACVSPGNNYHVPIPEAHDTTPQYRRTPAGVGGDG